MAKKGVSAEEKKTRMLELFYETGECYQLKVCLFVFARVIYDGGTVVYSRKSTLQTFMSHCMSFLFTNTTNNDKCRKG